MIDNQNWTYKLKVKKYREIDLKPGIHTSNCMAWHKIVILVIKLIKRNVVQ